MGSSGRDTEKEHVVLAKLLRCYETETERRILVPGDILSLFLVLPMLLLSLASMGHLQVLQKKFPLLVLLSVGLNSCEQMVLGRGDSPGK